MVIINYTLTKEDYSHYVQYVALHVSGYKRILIKDWLIKFFIYGALLFIIKLSTLGQNFDSYFFFSILVLVLIFIIPIFDLRYIYRKQAKTFAENPLNASLFDEYEITISETGISTKGRYSESKLQWASIVKKKEDNRFYYLFVDSQQAILLPKRSLKLKADVEELEKLLSRHFSF